MKFKLNKGILDGVITKLGKVLTTNSSIPILNGVLIEATEQFLHFTASNGIESIFVREPVNGENGIEVIEVGAAVLPREIFNLTKKLKEGIIEFATSEDCRQINVKQKRTKIDFAIESAEEYPKITSQVQPTARFIIPGKEFEEIVKSTAFAASDKDARPTLKGLNFRIAQTEQGLSYKVVATDSHRLAQICSSIPLPNEEVITFTVPATTLEQAIKSFDLKSDVAILTFPHQIALYNDNTIMYSSLIEGNYPPTDKLIPSDNHANLVFDRKELIDALELFSLVKEKDKLPSTQMTVGRDSVVLEAKTGTSRSQQEIQVISNQEVEDGFQIVFCVEYALNALKALHTKDVRMELNGTLRPFIFRNVYEADASKELQSLQLILPMRSY